MSATTAPLQNTVYPKILGVSYSLMILEQNIFHWWCFGNAGAIQHSRHFDQPRSNIAVKLTIGVMTFPAIGYDSVDKGLARWRSMVWKRSLPRVMHESNQMVMLLFPHLQPASPSA